MKITWTSRYSDTLEDDEFGRWGVVGLTGDFSGMGFKNGMPAVFEIAWIKKLKHPETKEFLDKFIVHPKFPYKGKHSFDSLEEAKAAIQLNLDWFIKCSK